MAEEAPLEKRDLHGLVFEAFPALIVAQKWQTPLASPTKDRFSKVYIIYCTIKDGGTVAKELVAYKAYQTFTGDTVIIVFETVRAGVFAPIALQRTLYLRTWMCHRRVGSTGKGLNTACWRTLHENIKENTRISYRDKPTLKDLFSKQLLGEYYNSDHFHNEPVNSAAADVNLAWAVDYAPDSAS